MSKTVQFQFKVGVVLTDVTSVVLRDPTDSFGIRRTDTGAMVVAPGTAFSHLSTGLYAYTFTEPEAGLNYEYWIEYEYAGNTKRLRQVLETGAGTSVGLAPSAYAQLGIDTVACGDSTLAAFLSGQADLVWAMQARRGVALDLQYQYYVSDLIVLAMDHVRMLVDAEASASAMHDTGQMDATNTSSADSTSSKVRTSSFTEASASSQDWSRQAARSSSSSSHLSSSQSASRQASSSDHSTMSQSANGSSYRTQSGSSTAMGSLASDGTSGTAEARSMGSTISRTTYEGGYLAGSGMPPGLTAQYTTSAFSVGGLFGLNYATGASAVYHQVTPTLYGRLGAGDVDTDDGAPGFVSLHNTSTSQHGRRLVGSQTGSGATAYVSNGTRTNNRSGSMSANSSASLAGNSSATQNSSSHEQQARTAASTSHSESTFHSTMTATSSMHRESAATDAMTATGSADREYYSQIFDALKEMWDDTQAVIRKLEQQMLLTSRYLAQKLTVVTAQSRLVGAAALPTASTLIQRPGVAGMRVLSRPFNRFIVR